MKYDAWLFYSCFAGIFFHFDWQKNYTDEYKISHHPNEIINQKYT